MIASTSQASAAKPARKKRSKGSSDDDFDGGRKPSKKSGRSTRMVAEDPESEEGSAPPRVAAAPVAPIEDDSDDDALLLATSHIWREPLYNYDLKRHAEKQRLEQDFDLNEQTRHSVTAARVKMMNEQRLVEPQATTPEPSNVILSTSVQAPVDKEEAKRINLAAQREVRLEKQRDQARKRREEERAKKEKDDLARRVKADEVKLAKAQELDRRAALSTEAREAEDNAIAERVQKEREAAGLKAAELALSRGIVEESAPVEGRGARKRKRKESVENEFGDEDLMKPMSASRRTIPKTVDTSRFSMRDDEGDDPDSTSRSYAAGPSRYRPPPPVDALGNPLPPTDYIPPPGATISNGIYYDSVGDPIIHPISSRDYAESMSSALSSLGYASDEDMGDVGGEVSSLDKGKSVAAVVPKKWKAIQDLEKKIWTQIAKRDIPKAGRVVAQSIASRLLYHRRISAVVAREARRSTTRTKGIKDVQVRAKRVMRETLIYMKGNEKKDRENRKKAEKEAIEKTKKEEDLREAKRAARKLNFLITQTELYSHFVGSKVKTSEAEDSADTAGGSVTTAPIEHSASVAAAIAAGDAPAGDLKALDFDADDDANLASHARKNALAAVDAAKQAAAAFDAAASNGIASSSKAKEGLTYDDDEMNFQNPNLMNGDVQVKQPELLTCTLKEYQLKGLNWLANLYEQGINGILADEMGLGKTVQSISLMAYLAEVHNIWGPFLVIAPASTLHNWQQEITRFTPGLKALPYWGSSKDRAVLRKFWNRKTLRYDRDAPFHILVTSYQLVVQDEKYFQGVKWQYMVLDEAQAIKSSTSARWKTLLGFRCRNRLLLTGTPIQNSMHELWALLHFIMPSLFDSHDEFSEWFSKDIEGNGDNKGAMNEHQLRRLHMILKPFMLRRIKKNVQNELGDKIEIDVFCELTPRQRFMYRTLRENISITDLVSRASNLNDDDSVKRLMNLIMQFRKVCNHPELFERADVTAPLAFASFNKTSSIVRDPPVLDVPYATASTIEYRIPKFLYREGGILGVVGEHSRKGSDTLYLDQLLNIWTPDYISKSLTTDKSPFAFTRLLNLSPAETSRAVKSHGVKRIGLAIDRENESIAREEYSSISDAPKSSLHIVTKASALPHDERWRDLGLTPLAEIEQNYRSTSRLARSDARFFMDPVVAPAIDAVCSDRSFVYDQQAERFDPVFSLALHGLPLADQDSAEAITRFESALPGFSPAGIISSSTTEQLPFPPMQVPQLRKLILDSGKLAKLDTLLSELKAGGHRVLLYFQMTRMIDLMEEYLAFRQHKYLRLDGSSTISERRDMVGDWQTKPDIFIFLLSTRAGGLGINLTAADTVIFYDSDWNPSNDAQAMDRAHRLGQTKQVTVYRLITKDTVDERIVQLARNKKLVQDAVVGSSSASGADLAAAAKTNDVVSLLLGEEEMEEGLRQAAAKRSRFAELQIEYGKKGAKTREVNKKNQEAQAAAKIEEARKRGMGGSSAWQDDDDDAFSFFTNPTTTAPGDDDDAVSNAGSNADSVSPVKSKSKSKAVASTSSATPSAGPLASINSPASTSTSAAPGPAAKKAKAAPDPNKPKRIRRSRAQMDADEAMGIMKKGQKKRLTGNPLPSMM